MDRIAVPVAIASCVILRLAVFAFCEAMLCSGLRCGGRGGRRGGKRRVLPAATKCNVLHRYHYLRIVRNMVYGGEGEPPQGSGLCALSDEECAKEHASESYCPSVSSAIVTRRAAHCL